MLTPARQLKEKLTTDEPVVGVMATDHIWPLLVELCIQGGLDYLVIDFRADWPLEIIFDKQSLVNYNAVFRFLMRIKRVNYMIQ